MSKNPYQVCRRCVMDTSALDITFDEKGICKYCTEFLSRSSHILDKDPAQRKRELEAFVAEVKRAGRGKRYDCLVGVSGGVDSSWVLVQAVKLGLRPLAAHMDNGWNSELAQNNIENLVRGLGVDLYTHVIEWNEYRKLMQSFFDADVVDVELLYDNAMLAVNYGQAGKHGIKYILAGTNQATEGMRFPPGWNWFKFDARNIRNLAGKFGGNLRLNTFPSIGTAGFIWNEFVTRRRWISFLDYFDFKKAESLEVLKRDFGYKPYPYKHYESIFTRFYQGYILPKKFGIDKRRLHLSTLIASRQMTRDEVLRQLEGIPYPSVEEQNKDLQYFLKKMGWTETRLSEYIDRPPKKHSDYATEYPAYLKLLRAYKVLTRRKSPNR